MSKRNPLQCTFDDARHATLIQGSALDTQAKIAFFEEMVNLARKFDARDRLAEQRAKPDTQTPTPAAKPSPNPAENRKARRVPTHVNSR